MLGISWMNKIVFRFFWQNIPPERKHGHGRISIKKNKSLVSDTGQETTWITIGTCPMHKWRVTNSCIQQLNQFATASSTGRDSVETSSHTQLPPLQHRGRRRPLHTFLHPNIVHHCCREADKGAVLCSMAWAKLVISLWDNPECLKWYLVGLVKSFEEVQQMNEILRRKCCLCRSNTSEFDQSWVCKSLT